MEKLVDKGNDSKALNQNIINVLNSLYYVMYEIDLDSYKYREFATVLGLKQIMPNEGDAEELLKTICNRFCMPEYRSRLSVFLDPHTFAQRLKKNKILTFEYRAVTVEWALFSVLPLTYDADGQVKSVVLAVRDISDVKSRDSLYQNLIQALAAPYNNLYTINMEDGSMQMHHVEGGIREKYGYAIVNMGYEKALGKYIDSEVLKDDRFLFDTIRTIEGCRKLFENTKEHSFNYRIFRDGAIHHYVAQVVKLFDQRNGFALGFRNVDAEHSAQELQSRALEEQMAVVSGLASDYFSVMLVDYQENKVTVRTAKDASGKLIGNFFNKYSSWSEGLKAYIETQVVESDRETLAEALSLESIRSHEEDYTTNYQKETDEGIVHMIVKVAYVDSVNGRRLAVIGTRNIEKEFQNQLSLLKIQEEHARQQEEARQQLEIKNNELLEVNNTLRRNLNVIGSVSTFFSVFYYVDLKDYSFTEVNRVEYESVAEICETSKNAIEAFTRVNREAIEDDYKQDFAEFTDLTTLAERLAHRQAISIQFVGKHAGWAEASFIAADRDADGNCTHVIWVVRTIQEQKEKDLRYQKELEAAKNEAETANMAKTSFLFNMSHDIRTPMNAIIGFRNLLEKHQDEPERRADYLEKIGESSNVLLSIINNVLEMARIEKGTVELDESAWSAEQFNDTLYSLFHELMVEKGIDFTRIIDVENNYVFCDPVKLREVFNNILSNAYKYTSPGGRIQMHLREIPCDREGYALYRTTITDTGVGISEEFLPHIFDEFSREKNTTMGKIEGTGLGMSIAKKLTELMEGTIEVQSEKGVGTTFTVTIPHKIAVKSDLWDHSDVAMDPEQFAGKRILLVEDVDLNAEIAMEILGDAGFIVDRAEDGLDCLDKLQKAKAGYYDLILMDIQMPNMNGYEAAKAIRLLEDESKAKTKIIAVTANAFEEDKREALKCGMNGHLAKPINVHELMKVLARVLK